MWKNYSDESVKGFDQGRSQVWRRSRSTAVMASGLMIYIGWMDGFWMRRGGGSPAGRGSLSKQGDLVEREGLKMLIIDCFFVPEGKRGASYRHL